MSQTTSRLTAWYLSRNGAASGPFATDIVLSMLRDGQLQPLDLVFREGETEWRPAVSYAELKQKPQTSNQATAAAPQTAADSQPSVATAHAANAKSLQWIVLRSHNSTYLQEGPFETQTIIDGLQTGKFQFAQYAWHIGMSQWMRIGDLREFDRRSRARTDRPHVPPPLPDPIEAVLLEDDKDAEAEEFHVAMRGVSKLDMTPNPLESMQALNVTNLGNVGIGGAAAESPEEKTAQERASRAVSLVVSTPNLAGVPWEQDISDGYAQSRELIDDEHSGVHAAVDADDVDDIFQSDDATNFASIPLEQVAQSLDQRFEQTLDKTPPPFVPPAPSQMAKDGWEKWGRYAAGTALVAVIGGFSVYLMTAPAPVMVKPVVQAPPVTPPVVAAPVVAPAPSVPNEANTAAAPSGAVAPSIALPATTAPSDLTVTGLKLDRADGQIIVQGSLPPDAVGSSRVDLQACKLEYSIVSPK